MSTPLRLDYAVNDADVIAAFKRQQAEMEKERKARQELEKQINSNASAQKTADKAATESAKNLATEQQKLSASAAKIAEAVRTPLAKYKAGLTELIDHYKSGRITQDDYRASVDKLKESYDDATGKTAAAAAAEKAHTAAVKDATAIAEKYATKEERVAIELKRLNELKAKGVLSSKDYTRAVAAENAKLTESTDAVSDSSGKFTANLTAMAVAGAGTVAFVVKMASKLEELRGEMAEDTKAFDKLSRKLGIQGSLSDAERKEQSRMVGTVALDAAVPIDKAFETATQLSSSGFEDPVKGGTLNTALALMQSSNQIDGDAASFIKGSGQFMTAFGMKKDQTNLADLGIRMQGLFKTTDVQAADLPEFAKAAPVLSGAGLSLEESLSTLTALRETMNAGEAATGARNVVSMMQTSGANAGARDALGSVGLKTEQVDIEGEGLKKALETLKEATSKLGDADRAEVLTKIFGRENVAAASILMESTDKLDKFGAMQREAGASFQKDVGTARTGAYADSIRADVTQQMDSVKHEDFTRQEELARQARINLRDRTAKDEWASGTAGGKFNAAILGMGGAVEDNVVRPLLGESQNLGPAHAKEMARLANQDSFGKDRQFNIPMPAELAEAVEKQVAVLERIEEQNKQQLAAQKQRQHAGLVAGRANQQREGGQ